MRTDRNDKFTKPWLNEWNRVEPNNHLFIQHDKNAEMAKNSEFNNSDPVPVVSNVEEFLRIVSDFSEIEGVILSGCVRNDYFVNIINAIPYNIPICLFSWGDMQRSPELFEQTKKYCKKNKLTKTLVTAFYHPYVFLNEIGRFLNRKSFLKKRQVLELQLYKRFDIFACSTENEFEDFVKIPGVRKDIIHCFGTVGISTSSRVKLCSGNSIQIGNSANYLNNHLDIFEIIKPLVKRGTKIIVPLTYGADPKYSDYVIRKGFSLFGNDFVPITKHLPYNEYQEFLSQSVFYISGQTTSTGLGNLMLALRRGAKVFVPRSCPIFSEFKTIGIPIFSLEDDLKNNSNAFTELTEEEKRQCQDKLYEIRNAERSLEGCRNVLALLRKIHAKKTNVPQFKETQE